VLRLIGAIIKHRGLISIYSQSAFWHIGFSIVTGVFFIYTLFHKVGDQDVSNCVNGSTDPNAQGDCKRAFDVVRGLVIAINIIFWILEFCAYSSPLFLSLHYLRPKFFYSWMNRGLLDRCRVRFTATGGGRAVVSTTTSSDSSKGATDCDDV
jgi:hypothetical protein